MPLLPPRAQCVWPLQADKAQLCPMAARRGMLRATSQRLGLTIVTGNVRDFVRHPAFFNPRTEPA